jgi:acetyl esterase/lipase
MEKIIAFFMAIIMFFAQLFGIKPLRQYRNVSYGEDRKQAIHLAIPFEAKGDCGMIVLVHGGGWAAGDKDDCWETAKSIAKEFDIVAVSVGYRLITPGGGVDCNAILDDIQKGIEKAIEKSAQKGVNITKIGIGGFSAGGHISLDYAYKCADECPVPVEFVFSYAGPTDMNDENWFDSENLFTFEQLMFIMTELTGTEVTAENKDSAEVKAELAAISPISYITPASVPTIILHGKQDNIVPFSNAETLDELLTLNGVKHEFFIFENSGHGLSDDPETSVTASSKLWDYINEYLK